MTKQTPLFHWHQKNEAKLIEFGGFLMPVSYPTGILTEHQTVRERVGLFDISHMGEIWIHGNNALFFLQKMTSNDLQRLQIGQAQYSLLLDPNGGVVDDILVYAIAPNRFMLCVNAANIKKDFHWLKQHQESGVEIEDLSPETGMFALQGPKSFQVLHNMSWNLADLGRFCWREISFQGGTILVSRTGYTGEDGIELFMPNSLVETLWEALLTAGSSEGILPIGLGARDTLRLEMGYPLYGHEISSEINPFEAGLAWVVKLEKCGFIGKEVLAAVKKSGIARRLVGLTLTEPGIPREDCSIIQNEKPIGKVLSGTFSPSLKVGIATGLIEQNRFEETREIFVDIRGKLKKAKIVSLPFLRKNKGDH